mgnify:CR=1 FL=1
MFDMISEGSRICFKKIHVIQRWFQELFHLFFGKLESIQQLVMGLNHSPIKEMSLFFMFYHSESTVNLREPSFNGPEFAIFDTIWSSDKLNLRNISGESEAFKLIYGSNVVILEKLLDICVETTRFEKEIPEKYHSVLRIITHY